MEIEADAILNCSNDLQEAKDPEVVERQLVTTCERLNKAEVKIKLFTKMMKNGVATNDVRHFVSNQAFLKSCDHKLDQSMIKKAMKNKLVDACSQARELRLKKLELEKTLKSEFGFPRKKCKLLIKNAIGTTANHRLKILKKTKKKYSHCEKKMLDTKEKNDFNDIPRDAWDILSGVNIFQERSVTPEQSADPMICSPNISLSKEELSFLRKGPRFMLRQETDIKDFKVELEKMTVKEKFNDCNKEPENTSLISEGSQSLSLSEEAENEAAGE